MEAGKELDALIAEKVMEWVRDPDPRFCYWRVPEANGDLSPARDRLHRDYLHCDCATFGHDALKFRPSTDMTAALKVLEHMDVRWEGAHFTLTRTRDGYTAEYFDPGYRPFQDIRGKASAATAPLAICRAALSSVAPQGDSQA